MKTQAKERWWTVPSGMWTDKTCFILAGGPSITGIDTVAISRLGKVIVINTSYRLLYNADILYFSDTKWWDDHRSEVRRCFLGWQITMGHPKLECCRSLRQGTQLGLSHDPGTLCHGGNSGYQAINLAYLFGACRIVLLGYDMRVVPMTYQDDQGHIRDTRGRYSGQIYWHSGHGRETIASYSRRVKYWIPMFWSLVQPLRKAGVEVVNCSPGSALPCWPIRPLDEILDEEHAKMARGSLQRHPLSKNMGICAI